MIAKRENKWCVFHGHPQKPGSKRDKPKGSIIKCYSFNPKIKGAEKKAKNRATKMHQAILISQR